MKYFNKNITALTSLILVLIIAVPGYAHAKTLSFTNTVLLRPDGDSEPELSIGSTGTIVYVALSWTQFQTNAWKGAFGQTPIFQGTPDARIANNAGGGEDADVDIGSSGTVHISTLIIFFNPVSKFTQLGVSAITCLNGDTSNNFSNCKAQILDTTQADRQWITSDGSHVYISYHDSGSSTSIHVQRSDDDGLTFHRVTDPITGQDGTTGNSTFYNDQGKLIADSYSHNVYTVWAAGVSGVQKGTTANFNNVYVTVSSDMGQSWTPHLVYSAPINTPLNNVFPALAVDPLTGYLYAGWSDAHNVYISRSTNQGNTWTSPIIVNSSPVNTAVFPWISARGNTIDYVYYGTNALSKDDPSAVWNTYMAQSTSGSRLAFTQSLVSNHPNHIGVVCTGGISCPSGTRNLLDLFQDGINPVNGLAAVIYTDDTITTLNGSPLPQVVVAFQTS